MVFQQVFADIASQGFAFEADFRRLTVAVRQGVFHCLAERGYGQHSAACGEQFDFLVRRRAGVKEVTVLESKMDEANGLGMVKIQTTFKNDGTKKKKDKITNTRKQSPNRKHYPISL